MKVLHLISSAGFFGAEKVLTELAGASAKPGSGVKPYVGIIRNAFNPHSEICEALRGTAVPCEIFECSGKWDMGTIRGIRSFIKAHKIDIVHSHGYKSNMYAFFATVMHTTKRVATLHNWINSDTKLRVYTVLDKLLLRYFDGIAVVSQPLMNEITAAGIPAAKVSFIRNGINAGGVAGNDNNGLKQSLHLDKARAVVGTIGRLSEEKGHDVFIRAAADVLRSFPGTRFLIVGDGVLRESLSALARQYGIGNDVVFAGTRMDVPALLRIMDVFVLPSRIEAMPMALLEAMAAGRPVIATDVGAVPDILNHGTAGILVPAGDPAALQLAIETLLQDGSARAAYARAASREIAEHYSADAMANNYGTLYARALGESTAPQKNNGD